jgi:YgiT-type zinc finger domain-containing protein
MKIPLEKCVFCEGNLLEKKVTEIIKGSGNTVTLKVRALVCQNCGERFYHLDTIRQFESMKAKLETQDSMTIGKSFEVE